MKQEVLKMSKEQVEENMKARDKKVSNALAEIKNALNELKVFL